MEDNGVSFIDPTADAADRRPQADAWRMPEQLIRDAKLSPEIVQLISEELPRTS